MIDESDPITQSETEYAEEQLSTEETIQDQEYISNEVTEEQQELQNIDGELTLTMINVG